jgi:hypothetical protein
LGALKEFNFSFGIWIRGFVSICLREVLLSSLVVGVSGYVVVAGGGTYKESRIWFFEIFKKDPKRGIVRGPFWEEEGNKSSDTEEEFVVQEGLREVCFHRVGCRALEDFENQACMEESSSNSGGGDEDDARSSEWEVISLSLSSHSLTASTTFETAAGTGQEEIGGEAVDVGLQSNYSFISSSSSSLSSPELQQQKVPSSDDDDADDGESLMVQFDPDSDKKRIPLGSSSSPELPPPKGLRQEQVALAAATTDDDELRPESDYVKEAHFSHVSSCTSHMQEELLQMSWSKPLPSG